MIQYWVSYWNDETGALEDGKGIVCASELSEALEFLKRWYGNIQTIHCLQWVGEAGNDQLIEQEALAQINWDET